MDEYFKEWLKIINRQDIESIVHKCDILYNSGKIFPSKNNVFKAFSICPYNNLKVVIIGQDPYPQKDIATGIAFGNSSSTKEGELSISLKVIRDAVINNEFPHNTIQFDNTLESWCKQGILMLNSSLTVEENKIGSHIMIWRLFIANILVRLSINNTGLIYVLLGKQAQSFEPYIKSQFNYILKDNHPSYYARINRKMPSTIFRDIDTLIKNMYNIPIEWYKEL